MSDSPAPSKETPAPTASELESSWPCGCYHELREHDANGCNVCYCANRNPYAGPVSESPRDPQKATDFQGKPLKGQPQEPLTIIASPTASENISLSTRGDQLLGDFADACYGVGFADGRDGDGWEDRATRDAAELRLVEYIRELESLTTGRNSPSASHPEQSASPEKETTDTDAGLVRYFANVVCPKLKEVLVPFGATREGWDDASTRLNRIADSLASRPPEAGPPETRINPGFEKLIIEGIPVSDPLTAPRDELKVMLDSLIDRAKDIEYSPHDEDYRTKLAAARSAIEDYVAHLQRERDDLTAELASCREWNDKLARPLALARAEVAELEKRVFDAQSFWMPDHDAAEIRARLSAIPTDTMRLNWLETQLAGGNDLDLGLRDDGKTLGWYFAGLAPSPTLRAAIDAAMSGE